MTAIVRHGSVTAPTPARAGLVLPGLGHLLTGSPLVGSGLIALDIIVGWAALAGVPRLGSILWPGHGTQIAIHPVISVALWPVLAAGLWCTAYRHAFPRTLTEEQRNGTWNVFSRHFRRNPTGMLGLFGVLFLLYFVLLTPLIAPYPPNLVDACAAGPCKNLPPSFAHLMGTDEYGRDLFSRVLYGGRISLAIGFLAASIAATIGTLIGAVAAFGGGWLDRGLMWFVDLLLSLPRLVLLLAISGMFRVTGPEGLFLMIGVLGLTGWMGVSRIVRSQVLSLKEQDFIQAARSLGMSNLRIVLKHLIPNALAPVIVFCSLSIGSTMIVEAGLTFLGLGVPPPTSTWGTIINDGRESLRVAFWVSTFPGLCIVLAVMSFNLLGDGLRDALDPKLRGR